MSLIKKYCSNCNEVFQYSDLYMSSSEISPTYCFNCITGGYTAISFEEAKKAASLENCGKQSNMFIPTGDPFPKEAMQDKLKASGSKNDSNYLEKPPLDLLSWEFLEGASQALGFGAAKYNKHNFKSGIQHSRLIAAALRHINQYNNGEDLDKESGLSHLAHAAASLNMLMWMANNRKDLDDRYKKLDKPSE